MAPYLRVAVLNYPRRQQYRRLSHAGTAALGSAITALLGLVAASAGEAPLSGFLVLAAAGLGLAARRWLSLVRRSRIGAQSEDEVRRALAALEAEGWRLRHSLAWQGRGDIGSVAIAPTGVAVAIETKTKTYDRRHLAGVREQAVWLARRRRRWARSGAHGVMCLVRARGVERVDEDVLVVSIDRLTHVLRAADRRCSDTPVVSSSSSASTAPLVREPDIAATRQEHCIVAIALASPAAVPDVIAIASVVPVSA